MATQFKTCSVDNCNKPAITRGYCCSHYKRVRRHGDPLAGGTPIGAPLRFIHEVALHHTGNECLTWPFSKNGEGYGKLRVSGKLAVASRYVCELAHGAPPTPEHEASHHCGKGHEGCIAPGHLSWKTSAGNKADMLVHGTHSRGERHGMAKLTEAAVREIIAMKGTAPQKKLAKRFRVGPTAIGNIQAGRRWGWLSEEASS